MMHLKPTWNMGNLQVAGAIAALDDDAHVAKTVATITEMRAYVLGELEKAQPLLGRRRALLQLLPAAHRGQRARSRPTVFEELLKRGVIVKDGSVSFIGLGKRYLRIDVSLKKQMDRLIWALTDISNGV